METQVSIFLSKFILAFGDFKNGYIEINYNNKKEIINYPQITPLTLVFPPKFIKDKQLITIHAKKKTGNKIKNLAHGELVLYKKNFIDGKGIVEKYITMVQLDSKVDTIKINKENMGQIFVKISLEEPFEEWQKKLPNKAGFSPSRTLYNKTLDNKENKTYRKINFDDNLSSITVTKIDKNKLDILNINLDQFISVNEIKKIKNKFENDYQNILPHDFTNLKRLNKNLYEYYIQLDEKYKNMLQNIKKENNDIKLKGKETWEKYKQNKKELYRLRIEYKLKKKQMNKEINSNKDQNKDLGESINQLNKYKKKIYNQILGEKENDNNNTIEEKQNDIDKITELLKKLYSLGYNIDDEMNEQEKTILNDILIQKEKEKKEVLKNEKEIKEEHNENKGDFIDEEKNKNELEEDENLSKEIVSLIERDVNDLYSRKLIKKMKIDQINAITYTFSTDEKQETISFKIENNNLICSNGQNFGVWVISNFNSK